MSIILNNIKITEFGADNFTFDSNVRFFHFQKYQSLGNERIERMEEQEEESVREIQRSFKSQSAGRPRGKGDCKSRQGSMEWEAWKKKEKIKTRRSGGERERCTISFMSDPLKFHSTIGSNLRPVRLSLRSKPVVSNLFPPSFVFWKARFEQRLIFTERNRFRDCFFLVSEERLEKNWKGERERKKEKHFWNISWNVGKCRGWNR